MPGKIPGKMFPYESRVRGKRAKLDNLTDVTLADGNTKSILTDNADRAFQGNVAMHVTHPVNLVVKF